MQHFVSGIDLNKIPQDYKSIILGAGCFWGVERRFWEDPNIYLTSVGYSGGHIDNPTYKQVCYEDTGHVEVVKVIFDPQLISLEEILKIFWECHDPSQGDRQGNDRGTQYRSVIFCENEKDLNLANQSQKNTKKCFRKQVLEKLLLKLKYLIHIFWQKIITSNT